MSNLNAYEHVFPIVAGAVKPAGVSEGMFIQDVYGTAFSIGGRYFLTAGHSIRGAVEQAWHGIAFPDGGVWQASQITDHEIFDELDIGIVAAEVPATKTWKWRTDGLNMLHQVMSVGYPYALDLKNRIIGIRAFSGHIVAGPTFDKLTAAPLVYELSFQVPRGLSGSPLVTFDAQTNVVGVIIGNRSIQMLVFSDKEIIHEPQKETIVERYESLQLGIALQAGAVLDTRSQLLATSLREHLRDHKLIV